MVYRLSVPYIIANENPTISISFCNKPSAYEPGALVTGDALVDAKKGVDQVKEICASCVGKAQVRWTRENEAFEGEEVVMREENSIFRGESADYRLSPGHHRFPFAFQLPFEIPASLSFECDSREGGGRFAASIRYTVKVVMKMKDHMSRNVEAESAFNALSNGQFDLSQLGLDIHRPSYGRNAAGVPNLCCQPGSVALELRTDKRGYLAGEIVYASACIKNSSGRDITASSLRLKTNVKMLSQRNEIGAFDDTVLEIECGAIPCEQTPAVIDKQLLLPRAHFGAPLTTGGPIYCNIIHMEYEVELRVRLAWKREPLRVAVGIVVGTAPKVKFTPPAGEHAAPTDGQPAKLIELVMMSRQSLLDFNHRLRLKRSREKYFSSRQNLQSSVHTMTGVLETSRQSLNNHPGSAKPLLNNQIVRNSSSNRSAQNFA